MQRRILILTDELAPPAYAPRVVSLCRYLSENDWLCTICSDRMPGVPAFHTEYAEVKQMQYYTSPSNRLRYIADKMFNQRERQFQRFVEDRVAVADFDIIFCSTCYYFPLVTTLRLAEKFHKPFVVDLRDIAEQWGNVGFMTHSLPNLFGLDKTIKNLYNKYNIRKRNTIISKANAVVTISPWHQKLLGKYNSRTHLIYNGFDPADFYPLDLPTEQFIISYAGRIYNTKFRDPRLVMQALGELIRERKLNNDIVLRFRVDNTSVDTLRQLAEQYNISNICDISTYIPKSELLHFMHKSSICLVLTCKSTPEGAHGIMGTKFFEALGVEKPVLCIRSDEECLEQVIIQTNAGLAARNVEDTKTFILDKYDEWKQFHFTRQKVNQYAGLFSRQMQSQQFEHLFLSLL